MKPRRSNRRGNGTGNHGNNENSPEKSQDEKNTEDTIPKSKTPPDKNGSPEGNTVTGLAATASVTSSNPIMHQEQQQSIGIEHKFKMAAMPPSSGYTPGMGPSVTGTQGSLLTGRGSDVSQPHSGVAGSLPRGNDITQPHSGGGIPRRLAVSEYDEVPGDNESPFALRKQPESPKMAPEVQKLLQKIK